MSKTTTTTTAPPKISTKQKSPRAVKRKSNRPTNKPKNVGVAVSNVRQPQSQLRVQKIMKGNNTVVHEEFVKNITGATSSFQVNDMMNPRNVHMFPWLSGIASSYDMWYPKNVSFIYRPRTGTINSGMIAMALDYDVTDDDSTVTFPQLMSMRGAVSGPIYGTHVLNFRPDETVMLSHKYFCSDSTVADRLAFPARLLLMASTETAGTIGDLYVNYTIQLFNPEPVFYLSQNSMRARPSASLNAPPNNLFGTLQQQLVQVLERGSDHNVHTTPNIQSLQNGAVHIKGLADQLVGAFTATGLSAGNGPFSPKRLHGFPVLDNMVYYVCPSFSGHVRIKVHLFVRLAINRPEPGSIGFKYACNYKPRNVGSPYYYYETDESASVVYLQYGASVYYTQSDLNLSTYLPDAFYTINWEAFVSTGEESEPVIFTFWVDDGTSGFAVSVESYIEMYPMVDGDYSLNMVTPYNSEFLDSPKTTVHDLKTCVSCESTKPTCPPPTVKVAVKGKLSDKC